jgi:2-deoxy-D-gluconate 3-dehydrogenase
MSQDFTGRVAIVTGAASGIGQRVALEFAERGARVVGVDLDAGVDQAVAELPGDGHHAIQRNLTEPAAAAEVVDEVVAVAGGVDILVNSAGIAVLDAAVDLSAEAWDSTIAVNLTASFRMAQAAGRIINLASQAGIVGLDRHVAYAASKAGIIGMTRVLSLEWARRGVTVNAVSPTIVETPLGRAAWAGPEGDAMKKLIPAGRFAQPDEVAGLIGYLAGERAGMITGENVLIDGGYTSI